MLPKVIVHFTLVICAHLISRDPGQPEFSFQTVLNYSFLFHNLFIEHVYLLPYLQQCALKPSWIMQGHLSVSPEHRFCAAETNTWQSIHH